MNPLEFREKALCISITVALLTIGIPVARAADRGCESRANHSLQPSRSPLPPDGAEEGTLTVTDGQCLEVGMGPFGPGSDFQSVIAATNGGQIYATDSIITSTGLEANALSASEGRIDLLGGEVSVTGNGSYGLNAENNGIINVKGTAGAPVKINALANYYTVGAFAKSGGVISIDNAQINHSGTRDGSMLRGNINAAIASIDGGHINLSKVELNITGRLGEGLYAGVGGSIFAKDSTINSSGDYSYAISVTEGGVKLQNVNILSASAASHSIWAVGAQAEILDSTITNLGSGKGLRLSGDLTIRNTAITTVNASAIYFSNGSFLGDRLTITSSKFGGPSVELHVLPEHRVSLTNSSISTMARDAIGLYIIGQLPDAQAFLDNITITSTGENSRSLLLQGGATLSNSRIFAQGAGSRAVLLETNKPFTIRNSEVRSPTGTVFEMLSGTIVATDSSIIEGGGLLTELLRPDLVNLITFDGHVQAFGDIRSTIKPVTWVDHNSSKLSLLLSNKSRWRGATDATGQLTLLNGSTWEVTGDSQVGSVSLADSTVAFDYSHPSHKTLDIYGDFHTDDSLLIFNSVLNDDTSPTDVIHVHGNTSGNAWIKINNVGSAGAQTDEGIRLLQVDGVSDGKYALAPATRAVSGSYEYFLFQGSRSDPSNGDWYLRSELSTDPDPVTPDPDPVTPDPDPVIPDPDPVTPGPDPDPVTPDPDPATLGPGPVTPDPDPNPILPTGPDKPRPLLRPEAGAYLANQAAAQSMFLLSPRDRAAGSPSSHSQGEGRRNSIDGWMRVSNTQAHINVQDQLLNRSRHNVLQLGADLIRWGSHDRGVAGVMVASGQASSRTTSNLTAYGADGQVRGQSIGLYGSWLQGNEMKSGQYVDVWLQAGRFKNSVAGDLLAREHYRANSTSLGIEAGYSFRFLSSEQSTLIFEPHIQGIWIDYRMKGNAHREVNGTMVKPSNTDRLQTRMGASLYRHAQETASLHIRPSATLNWIHSSAGLNDLWMGEQEVRGGEPRDRFEAKIGMELYFASQLRAWGEFQTSRGSHGYRSIGAQLGVRYSW